jgi:gamma-soluble NSF attachment protein
MNKISALEDKAPEEAIKLYDEACSLLEEDGKEQMAFDLYRSAAALYVKLEK